MTKIKDLPRHERPREKLIEKGSQNLKDKELPADWERAAGNMVISFKR